MGCVDLKSRVFVKSQRSRLVAPWDVRVVLGQSHGCVVIWKLTSVLLSSTTWGSYGGSRDETPSVFQAVSEDPPVAERQGPISSHPQDGVPGGWSGPDAAGEGKRRRGWV